MPELQQVSAAAVADTFYRSIRERRLTAFGASRRRRVEQSRLALLHRIAGPPGELVEIGPGDGSLAARAVEAGWRYRAVEASPALAADLRAHGFEVTEAWAPPIPAEDASCDVSYADQVHEHMAGIDAARAFVTEWLRALQPGGVLFVVVPDYLKERAFFWDIEYTHNFVTTERRMRQLLYASAFVEIAATVRSIGAATGLRRRRNRGRRAPGQPARSRCCLAVVCGQRSCSSVCGRTCSKPSPSLPAGRRPDVAALVLIVEPGLASLASIPTVLLQRLGSRARVRWVDIATRPIRTPCGSGASDRPRRPSPSTAPAPCGAHALSRYHGRSATPC